MATQVAEAMSEIPTRITRLLYVALVITAIPIATTLATFVLANVTGSWSIIPDALQGAGLLLLLPLGLIGAILLLAAASISNRRWLWWASLVAMMVIIAVSVFFAYLLWLLQAT